MTTRQLLGVATAPSATDSSYAGIELDTDNEGIISTTLLEPAADEP